MKQEEEQVTGLPENAFRELKPGETYNPLMSPDKKYPEVNVWSVSWGICMAILFSAAAAYLGLKVGQVFEAAIPIAIIAVGVSSAAKRKHALGENVIIQSIGASSGVIVAGAIFTLPALYILQESYPQEVAVTFAQVFISSLLGGVLGILFLIPFRKYFVSDMHGKYGRERWQSGQAAAGRRSDRRSVRLHRGHFRLVERELYYPFLFMGRDAGREDQASVQSERRRSRIGSGLYRRLKICCYYLLRLTGRVVDHHSWHVTHLG